MLSSIHPLGERARGNRWGVTAGAFTVAALAAASLAGTVLGVAGGWLLGAPSTTSMVVLGGLVVVAGALDLAGVSPPGPHRQVNERWIGVYRGWVYGAGFGAQLGAGMATYVVTWGVWVTFAIAVAAGSPIGGAVVGLGFGAGRSLPVLAARWIDRPSRLGRSGAVLQRIATPVFRLAGVATTAAGIGAIVAGVG